MKKYLWLMIPAAVCLTGCASTREYNYNFDEVKAALNERIERNQWTARSTEYSRYTEPTVGTVGKYKYYHWQQGESGIKIYYEIDIERLDANRCEVSVYASDYDSWWYKILNETTLQRDFHNRLLSRLKGGQWMQMGYEPSPYYARGNYRKKGVTAGGAATNSTFPSFGTSRSAAPASSTSTGIPPYTGTTSSSVSSPSAGNAGAPPRFSPSTTAPSNPPPAVKTPSAPAGDGVMTEDTIMMDDLLF